MSRGSVIGSSARVAFVGILASIMVLGVLAPDANAYWDTDNKDQWIGVNPPWGVGAGYPSPYPYNSWYLVGCNKNPTTGAKTVMVSPQFVSGAKHFMTGQYYPFSGQTVWVRHRIMWPDTSLGYPNWNKGQWSAWKQGTLKKLSDGSYAYLMPGQTWSTPGRTYMVRSEFRWVYNGANVGGDWLGYIWGAYYSSPISGGYAKGPQADFAQYPREGYCQFW